MNDIFLSILFFTSVFKCSIFRIGLTDLNLGFVHIKKEPFHFLLQIIAIMYLHLSLLGFYICKNTSLPGASEQVHRFAVIPVGAFSSEPQLAPDLPHHFTFQLRLASTPWQWKLEFLDLVFLQNRFYIIKKTGRERKILKRWFTCILVAQSVKVLHHWGESSFINRWA